MKLPANYVPGVGVVKATAKGGFGQRLLEKMGWKDGEGLGKNKNGITEAIAVKKKADKEGVGSCKAFDWAQPMWKDLYETGLNKMKGSSTSTSTSLDADDDSSSDSETEMKIKSILSNVDGTLASSSAMELEIYKSLSKDKWGRWGGRDGKMARIREQEKKLAREAREKLGLKESVNEEAASVQLPKKKKKGDLKKRGREAGEKLDVEGDKDCAEVSKGKKKGILKKKGREAREKLGLKESVNEEAASIQLPEEKKKKKRKREGGEKLIGEGDKDFAQVPKKKKKMKRRKLEVGEKLGLGGSWEEAADEVSMEKKGKKKKLKGSCVNENGKEEEERAEKSEKKKSKKSERCDRLESTSERGVVIDHAEGGKNVRKKVKAQAKQHEELESRKVPKKTDKKGGKSKNGVREKTKKSKVKKVVEGRDGDLNVLDLSVEMKLTPREGWWGARRFTSAGFLSSMREKKTALDRKDRQMFDEGDQEKVYMFAHNHKRKGHVGLGMQQQKILYP